MSCKANNQCLQRTGAVSQKELMAVLRIHSFNQNSLTPSAVRQCPHQYLNGQHPTTLSFVAVEVTVILCRGASLRASLDFVWAFTAWREFLFQINCLLVFLHMSTLCWFFFNVCGLILLSMNNRNGCNPIPFIMQCALFKKLSLRLIVLRTINQFSDQPVFTDTPSHSHHLIIAQGLLFFPLACKSKGSKTAATPALGISLNYGPAVIKVALWRA